MDSRNILNLPASTIVDRVVSKEKIYSHGDVNSSVKRKFIDQIDKIVWSNKISPQTLNVSSGQYDEIEVFQIYLKNGQIDNKVLNIIDGAIPYLVLFVLVDGDFHKLVMAYKANGKVARYFESGWTNGADFEIIGNSVDQIYASILHTLEPKLHSDTMPLNKAIEEYEHKLDIQKQIDKLTKEIAREPNSARKQELAKRRAELSEDL